MKRQRFYEENIASIRHAELNWITRCLGNRIDISLCDSPCSMRPRRELQAPIVSCGCIQMDTREHHPLKKFYRRLDVPDARLPGPVAETKNCRSLANSDYAILMPGQ